MMATSLRLKRLPEASMKKTRKITAVACETAATAVLPPLQMSSQNEADDCAGAGGGGGAGVADLPVEAIASISAAALFTSATELEGDRAILRNEPETARAVAGTWSHTRWTSSLQA